MITITKGETKCAAVESFHIQLKRKRPRLNGSKANICASVLKTLMTHGYGYVFNQPVDPVKLNIPDYFDIISQPMDLSTIKHKLEKGAYSNIQEFASDVRLTFSNATNYNPPQNPVHYMAAQLENIFNERWNAVEAKYQEESVKLRKPCVQKLEKKIQSSGKPCCTVSSLRKTMNFAEKQKLRDDLASLNNGKMPDPVIKFLQQFEMVSLDGKIELDVDVLDGETASELQRIIKSCLKERLTKSSASENAGAGSQSSEKCKKLRLVKYSQTDRERLLTSESNLCSDNVKKSDNLAANKTTSSILSHCSTSESDDTIDETKGETGVVLSHLPPADTSCREDLWSGGHWGNDLSYDEQLSPSRALRAATLKSRFADTILKARQGALLSQIEKGDPVKMQREREKLERQQLEEKARIEAEKARIEAKVKAAEAARVRSETEMKLKLEREREAARLALEQMVKTVEFHENTSFLNQLSMLDARMGNPLEQLGLFIKPDDLEDEDEDFRKEDVEEGEIEDD